MKANSRKLILPVLLVGVLFTTSQAHAALIAHYAFDSSLTADSSGNGRVLSTGNSPTFSGIPRFGSNSASFQSIDEDFFYISDSVLQNFGTGDFAVSLWYRRADSGTYDLIGNGTQDNIGGFPESGFTLQVSNANATPTLQLFAGSTSVISGPVSANDSSAFQHVLFQRENDEFQLYVNNGTAVTNTPVPDINLSTGLAFAIGARAKTSGGSPDGPSNHYSGLMDEVFIFNNALSPEEIQGLFENNTFPGIGGGGGGGPLGGIPEPTSFVMLLMGLVLAACKRRRVR